jgi:hypothetical protein
MLELVEEAFDQVAVAIGEPSARPCASDIERDIQSRFALA